MGKDDTLKKSRILFLILLVSLIVIIGAGFKASKTATWPVIFVFMIIMFMAIGWSIKDRLLGVLINERRSMSLSRFQMVLWTLIVLLLSPCCVREQVRALAPWISRFPRRSGR